MIYQFLKDILSLLYQTLGFSVIFACASMFFFLYARENGGYKKAVRKWMVTFKTEKRFRYIFVFMIYIMIVFFRTLFNRDMWSNPLSNIIGIWSIWNDDGSLTLEIPENIILFVPFTLLIFCLYYCDSNGEFTFKSLFLRSLEYSFVLSFGIESCQLFFRLGTWQLSDLFYNTLGGTIGGLIYYIGYKIKHRGKTI